MGSDHRSGDGMAAVGLEVGATWTRAVRVSSDGTVTARRRRPTAVTAADIAASLADLWRELGTCRPIGLAAAPAIDEAGVVTRWPSRPQIEGGRLLVGLGEAAADVHTVDDGSAAAVAEHLVAAAGSLAPSSSLLIGLGTGVGGGAVLLDRLWRGSQGQALDLGHIPVAAAAGKNCPCGREGCLQTVASGRALEVAARMSALELHALLAPHEDSRETATAAALIAPLAAGVAEAVVVLERLFDPDRIILAGGLLASDAVERAIRDAAEAYGVCVPLLRGRWGTWPGAVGAAVEALRVRGIRVRRLRDGDGDAPCRLALIQGPNLNLVGEREPEHYGGICFDELEIRVQRLSDELGCTLICVQSNDEAVLVDLIQNARGHLDGAIVNPAALTANGYALRDALVGCQVPFVEVHLSNVHGREAWHRESCFSDVAIGTISGLRGDGYEMALRALVRFLSTDR